MFSVWADESGRGWGRVGGANIIGMSASPLDAFLTLDSSERNKKRANGITVKEAYDTGAHRLLVHN